MDHRPGANLIAGHRRRLTDPGAVPRMVVWDNQRALSCWRPGGPQLTDDPQRSPACWASSSHSPSPWIQRARANGFLETSFLPGRVFTSAANFNVYLADWLAKANRRTHHTVQAQPSDRLETDRSRILSLLSITPPRWKASMRLLRAHYVSLGTCNYSVRPFAIGRRIIVTCNGVEVTRHARSWTRHQTIPDPDQATASAAGRRRATTKQAPRTSPRSRSGRTTPTTASSASSTADSLPMKGQRDVE